MTDPVDLFFQSAGQWPPPNPNGAECFSEETLAGYMDGALAPVQRAQVEEQALQCPVCFELLRAAVDTLGVRRPEPAQPFRVLARLKQRGLEILNHLELRIWALTEGPAPALGALRGGESCDLVSIHGPGNGLDEIELQAQPDGTARLVVRGSSTLELERDEQASIALATDGQAREKRPFSSREQAFASLGPGRHTVSVSARAPGGKPRTLAEATLELQG